MNDEAVFWAAQAVRPLLGLLLEDKAQAVEAEIVRLLAEADRIGREGAASEIFALLTGEPETRAWLQTFADGLGLETEKSFGLPTTDSSVPSTYAVVRIPFATDRSPSGETRPSTYFTHERGQTGLVRGTCEVSVPTRHRKGELEGPSWRRFEFQPDPAKHITLLSLLAQDAGAFFDDVAAILEQAPSREALVFVHGYNCTFEDAARRMAQIVVDLAFRGVPALYSWPSHGRAAAYLHDSENADWTAGHLADFLDSLVNQTGIEAIHVLAHSMGNRAMTAALRQIANTRPAARFKQVILAAPDLDADVFRQQLVPQMAPAAGQLTMYASSTDLALQASKKLRGFRRAGDPGDQIIIASGMDSIDATGADTSFLGHSYFGSTRSILSDIHYLLLGVPASSRSDLRAHDCPSGSYFRFVL